MTFGAASRFTWETLFWARPLPFPLMATIFVAVFVWSFTLSPLSRSSSFFALHTRVHGASGSGSVGATLFNRVVP